MMCTAEHRNHNSTQESVNQNKGTSDYGCHVRCYMLYVCMSCMYHKSEIEQKSEDEIEQGKQGKLKFL